MSRIHCLILGLVLIATAACSGTNQESVTSEQTEESATVPETGAVQDTNTVEKTVKKVAPIPEPAPAPPRPKYTIVPAGTIIPVRLQDALDSSINQSGDTFRALIDTDLLVENKVAVPKGSMVEGALTFVERSGRVSGRAKMSIQFLNLTIGPDIYPLQSEILSFEAEGTKKKDAAKVGIISGIGAAIGAIAGGGKGAAIGAAAGAGAGGATVAATRGEELKFAVEDAFEFTLNEDIQIRQ